MPDDRGIWEGNGRWTTRGAPMKLRFGASPDVRIHGGVATATAVLTILVLGGMLGAWAVRQAYTQREINTRIQAQLDTEEAWRARVRAADLAFLERAEAALHIEPHRVAFVLYAIADRRDTFANDDELVAAFHHAIGSLLEEYADGDTRGLPERDRGPELVEPGDR